MKISDVDRSGPTQASTVGSLHLLPSELLHTILLRLPLPDLLRLRSLSRPLLSLVSAPEFLHIYNSATTSSSWLFLLHTLPPRRPLLRGFLPSAARWFSFPLSGPTMGPNYSSLYLLAAASPDLFLFASNSLRRLIAVNIATGTARSVPDFPLGPRDTSSWRRSGLKLVPSGGGDSHFRFLFAELIHDRPVLFEYSSATDAWRSIQLQPPEQPAVSGGRYPEEERDHHLHLHLFPSRNETVIVSTDGPAVHRPVFREARVERGSRLQVYGDGYMAVVRWRAEVTGSGAHMMRVVEGVEVWGLGSEGREWELVSKAEEEEMMMISTRPYYGVMMGCLEERNGVVRLVLMANCKGAWDLTWLNYDMTERRWERVPVPDCGADGLNMAGIAISSSFLGFRM